MSSLKLFVVLVCLAGLSTAQFDAGLSALSNVVPFAKQVLDVMIPKIMLLEYKNVPTKEGYRFNYKTSDGSYREEVGMIMNPGTDKEELVVMGSYSYTDGNTETVAMYTADKNGYRPRVQFKSRGVAPKLRQNLVG